jgi:hypothetical protein
MDERYRSPRSIVRWLVRNLVALALVWLLGFVFVQVGERALGGWPASEAGQLVSFTAGVAMALRLRAPVVAYVAAAMAAYSASELAIHSVYGLRAAQGAASHFAVMGAGALGVALGALLARRAGRGPASHPATVQAEPLANPIGDTRSPTSERRSTIAAADDAVATT